MGVPYAYRAGRYAYGKPIRVYSYGLSHMHTGNICIWVRTLWHDKYCMLLQWSYIATFMHFLQEAQWANLSRLASHMASSICSCLIQLTYLLSTTTFYHIFLTQDAWVPVCGTNIILIQQLGLLQLNKAEKMLFSLLVDHYLKQLDSSSDIIHASKEVIEWHNRNWGRYYIASFQHLQLSIYTLKTLACGVYNYS